MSNTFYFLEHGGGSVRVVLNMRGSVRVLLNKGGGRGLRLRRGGGKGGGVCVGGGGGGGGMSDDGSQIVQKERSDSRSMVLCHTLDVSREDCLCRVFYCVVVVFINVSGHVLD